MANEVVPETSWGPNSFGLADLRSAEGSKSSMRPRSLATRSGGCLHPAPPTTAVTTAASASRAWRFLLRHRANAEHPNEGLSQCHGCATEDVVTPYASFLALDVAPRQAYANIQNLRSLYPGLYGSDGFFDAVSPTTGAVGHRYLVLDQSMIMASLDKRAPKPCHAAALRG